MEDVLNLIYDNNLNDASLQPQLTYWIAGECPNCRVLRAEGIVKEGNTTYLAFFDLENKSVKLVPANETQVKEYLQFFEEHGGKVLPCNSNVSASMGNSTGIEKVSGNCIVPALVKVKNNG